MEYALSLRGWIIFVKQGQDIVKQPGYELHEPDPSTSRKCLAWITKESNKSLHVIDDRSIGWISNFLKCENMSRLQSRPGLPPIRKVTYRSFPSSKKANPQSWRPMKHQVVPCRGLLGIEWVVLKKADLAYIESLDAMKLTSVWRWHWLRERWQIQWRIQISQKYPKLKPALTLRIAVARCSRQESTHIRTNISISEGFCLSII